MSQKLSQSSMLPQTLIVEPSLCKKCSDFNFWAPGFVIQDKKSNLRANTSCDFCKLRHGACIKVPEIPGSDDIRFNIRLASSALTLNNQSSPALTICGTEELNAKVPGIQVGNPRLPDGEPRFEICRQWLEDCDTHNSCKLVDRFNQIAKGRPTRLLNVGEENAAQLHLYETNEKDVDLKYLALSHPWGDKRLHSHFMTNVDNYENHKKGISETNLPDLFKDAIKLTRALRCRYIWIDSLCIKQGKGGDFESEAERMELVYSMAYCVIATTHATGNSDSFLTRRSKRDFVKIDKDGTPFYVCEPIDDFQKHVLDGHLNTRGWVLQERALARRTIHFTKEQMYWECGEGIRCETLTKMKNDQAAFLGDPNFPLRAMQSPKGTKTLFYQVLYKQYSRLKFSCITDRRLAIAGLEQRLIRDFKVDGGFGVFQAPPERTKDHGYFGRSLLWKRGEEIPELTMIDYSKEPVSVPSWSWMAYKEGIDYMQDPLLPFNEVVWETREINSPWKVTHSSQSWHTGVRGQSTALRGTARSFSSATALEGEGIWYDRNLRCCSWDSGESHIRYIRVGSAKKGVGNLPVDTLYVLLVHPKPDTDTDTGVYERVGVAALKTHWIKKDDGITVQIV
ncbi:heterokaryon incompatibility protein-domain-containing protein [Xylaria arbuscula]|nr:heterokaryon incompatibility protein-domain-containing protein [Xylaria arbuscula]